MTKTPADSRPNIVLVVCDQLRADHLGFAGNTDVRTPNLDALAEDSMVFDKAYVANPTCMPNRASLMTGRWPSAHGTRTNGIPLAPDSTTFVEQLADSGYQTYAVGKLHHQNMGWELEPDQRQQVEDNTPELLDDTVPDARRSAVHAGWDQWENVERHNASRVEMPESYYGYQHVDLIIGHGDTPAGHWKWWARDNGVEPDDATRAAQWLSGADSWDQVYTSEIPTHCHPTEFVGAQTEQRIREASRSDDPFFMFMSFPDPHHPFAPPQEYADSYDPDSFELPRGFWQDHHASPTHIRVMQQHRGVPDEDPTMAFSATEQQYRKALAAQYGLIEFMDEQVGRMLQTLEDVGQAENTIVIFTADHGDMFGDHGLMLKHFVHYDAVTRVPLVWHDPRNTTAVAGQTQALVSTVDIPATILQHTNIRPPVGHQGRDFTPVLQAPTAQHRRAVLIEEEQIFSPQGLPVPSRIRTVVTDEGRLTRYFGSTELEVYDHQSDPDELRNVAGDPQHQEFQGRMAMALAEAMAAADDDGISPTAAA